MSVHVHGMHGCYVSWLCVGVEHVSVSSWYGVNVWC